MDPRPTPTGGPADPPPATDVAVVGGGLAGLAAAATAARAGSTVTLFEARHGLGGRARTEVVDGYSFNQGAHALYKAGAGIGVLRELGVSPRGHAPGLTGGFAFAGGEARPFSRPSTSGGVKVLGPAVALLRSSTATRAAGQSFATWLDRHAPDPKVRATLEMLVRTATYVADAVTLDAEAALTQARRAAHNVLYLDGGWSQLVDGLRTAAAAAGARFVDGKVTGLSTTAGGFAVETASGVTSARSVIVAAGGPAAAAGLLHERSGVLDRWAADAQPVHAACLDVALRSLPSPKRTVVLGLGEPVYANVHSAVARLAPGHGALIHALRYEPDRVTSPAGHDGDPRAELEAMLDAVHPGWREVTAEVKFRRNLVVAHDRPVAGRAGPPADITTDDVDGLFLAGDWITTDGLLADAALSSGRRAGCAAARATLTAPRPTRSGHQTVGAP